MPYLHLGSSSFFFVKSQGRVYNNGAREKGSPRKKEKKSDSFALGCVFDNALSCVSTMFYIPQDNAPEIRVDGNVM